ncbi:MAG: XRE family transcriptional regulator [Blastomonas sp. CACIA14H2]|jgi:antitoxin HigA-1|uniref:HigA family addiction module antitoxin n=1 Tax=unclassified Blastomonas TaxID=2626550 RepID=UPI0003CFCB2F|nr:HigA family addiction module antitoxin [Blastomonas sp. UPD001]ESZ86652.1 MAG: XRE family transcriptional regulator [Blastomonas sp. CACIA14H2]
MAIKLHNRFALHPGPWLRRNFIEPYGLTQSDAAARLDVTRVALSNLLNGKSALSPEMAIRFEMAFGVAAKTLLRMQSAHDLARAQSAAKVIKVSRIEPPRPGVMAA